MKTLISFVALILVVVIISGFSEIRQYDEPVPAMAAMYDQKGPVTLLIETDDQVQECEAPRHWLDEDRSIFNDDAQIVIVDGLCKRYKNL